MLARHFVPDHVMITETDDGMVLLNTDSGEFYALSEISVRLWGVVIGKEDLESAIRGFKSEYDVDENTLREDLEEFIGDLVKADLCRSQLA